MINRWEWVGGPGYGDELLVIYLEDSLNNQSDREGMAQLRLDANRLEKYAQQDSK